jgi:hypothetical protein
LGHRGILQQKPRLWALSFFPSRSFFRLQPDLDEAAVLAQSVAHREPTAARSQDPDSLLQSHFFVFNPSSTRRLTLTVAPSERLFERLSGQLAAQAAPKSD